MSFDYPRKYYFNHEFFLKWSPEMAYILGFWFADGYMSNDKSYRITFSSKDKVHLENIAKRLEYNCPVKNFRRNGKPDSTYSLTLRSKALCNDIKLLGGTNAKSFTMQFPEIPKVFLVDFIRGYFDGDGSVHLTNYIRTKDHRNQTDLRSSFVSGSYQFLFKLKNILTKSLDLTNKTIHSYTNKNSKRNHWRLYYGTKDTLKFLKSIYYPDCSLYLDRKLAIYQKYLKLSTRG